MYIVYVPGNQDTTPPPRYRARVAILGGACPAMTFVEYYLLSTIYRVDWLFCVSLPFFERPLCSDAEFLQLFRIGHGLPTRQG